MFAPDHYKGAIHSHTQLSPMKCAEGRTVSGRNIHTLRYLIIIIIVIIITILIYIFYPAIGRNFRGGHSHTATDIIDMHNTSTGSTSILYKALICDISCK